ncbi:MAG TPA: SPFH domain-containing protein, partial [Ktedonobacterales bacterium]|nr:SPFH domain-containing protein [Ktedonobacterales bacterium]
NAAGIRPSALPHALPDDQDAPRGGPIWRALRSRANRPATQPPGGALWFRLLRHWSPGLIPPLLGVLLLLAAGALATHPFAHLTLVDPHVLTRLFVVYLVVGTLYGLGLYFASDASRWWLVLVGGLATYLIATFAVIGGATAAFVAALIILALAVRYCLRHRLRVEGGHVTLTRLAGGYHRTLLPGWAILVPGERTLATLDTTERRYTCPTQRAGIPIDAGENYVARAAATVSFNLLPREAYRAVTAPDRWERETHDLVCSALEESLTYWGTAMIREEGAVPDRMLSRTFLDHLRRKARERGVHVLWVSVRDIWLAPEGETLPVDEWDTDATDDEDESESDFDDAPMIRNPPRRAQTPPLAPRPRASSLPFGDDEDEDLGSLAATATVADDEQRIDPANAAEVLSDAYDAVREHRIQDPATIRQIAKAFLHVASDHDLNATFPFDAREAARILIEQAKHIESERRGQRSGRSFDGN